MSAKPLNYVIGEDRIYAGHQLLIVEYENMNGPNVEQRYKPRACPEKIVSHANARTKDHNPSNSASVGNLYLILIARVGTFSYFV